MTRVLSQSPFILVGFTLLIIFQSNPSLSNGQEKNKASINSFNEYVFPGAEPHQECEPQEKNGARMGKYSTETDPIKVCQWYLKKWIGDDIKRMDGLGQRVVGGTRITLVVHDYHQFAKENDRSVFVWAATATIKNKKKQKDEIINITITRAKDEKKTHIAVAFIDQIKIKIRNH